MASLAGPAECHYTHVHGCRRRGDRELEADDAAPRLFPEAYTLCSTRADCKELRPKQLAPEATNDNPMNLPSPLIQS